MGRLALAWLAALDAGLLAAALRQKQAARPPAAGLSRAAVGASNVGGWDLCVRPSVRDGPQTIPKIIHHTYVNESALPWRLSMFRQTWPFVLSRAWQQPGGWSSMFWSDDDNRKLIRDNYPWFLETYDSYEEVISRVDAARIFMLHKYGGVYSDLDIELLRNPAPLFSGDLDLVFFYQMAPHFRDRRMVDAVEPFEMGYVTNALMASKPGHPFWLFLAEKMMHAQKHKVEPTGKYDRRDVRIFWTSGPCVLQNALAEYQLRDPGAKVAFYSHRFWSPYKYDCPEDQKCEFIFTCQQKYPQAYFVSHWTGTWNHCEVGTCTSDDKRPLVLSLMSFSSEVGTARRNAGKEAVCL